MIVWMTHDGTTWGEGTGTERALPDVSVIVWTRSRATTLPRALASVAAAAASVPDVVVETIIVDDGDEPAALPARTDDDDRVRVIVGPRDGAGAARAAGLRAAQGELIAYCDDDDEWTVDHLRLLLDELSASSAVALVYGDAAWRDATPEGAAAVADAGPGNSGPDPGPDLGPLGQVRASQVLHRARAARDVGGFDPVFSAYEAVDLWLRMDAAHLVNHLPRVVTVHERHPAAGTGADQPAQRERLVRFHKHFRPCREHEAFHRQVTPFNPVTWQPTRRELAWDSPLNDFQSFGQVGRHLLRAVRRAGIDVTLAAPLPPGDPEFAHLPVSHASGGRIGFSYEYWHRPDQIPTDLLVVATMREGTLVPKARVNAINRTASLLYVPCRQNLESFRDCGVRVPIKVLPYGVDPGCFPLLARPRTGDEPYTFGTFGAISPRKGTEVLVTAFRQEFTAGEPVRLLLKSVDDLPFVPPVDDRIEVKTGFWGPDQLRELLRTLDAFVLPSRAEGFGLCGLEAMATGLPTIATGWGGPADYLDPDDSFPLRYELVDARATEANGVRYFGEWAEPDVDHLRAQLRWLYEHRAEAATRGRAASARVHRDWTWDRAARQLRDDVDLLASGVSPA